MGLNLAREKSRGAGEHVLTDLRFGNEITDDDILIDALHGAVSSDVAICSRIGVELLKKGGNAVDAAIGITTFPNSKMDTAQFFI